jgi:hypothetical protein
MDAEPDSESFWSLFKLNLQVKFRNFKEFWRVVFRFYRNRMFCQQDLYLLSLYLWQNPFKISKEFLLNSGAADPYAYGETPLTTFAQIAEACQITAKDTLVELGCGRGRSCFWLHCFYGCRVIGIDFVPLFIEKAQKVKERYQLESLEFRCEDMLTSHFDEGTIFYLYGTCLDDEVIRKLIDKFRKLPAGTKIITVSYPLNDYTRKPLFSVLRELTLPFTWGEGVVYIQELIPSLKQSR